MIDQPLSILVLQMEDASEFLTPLSNLQETFMLIWNWDEKFTFYFGIQFAQTNDCPSLKSWSLPASSTFLHTSSDFRILELLSYFIGISACAFSLSSFPSWMHFLSLMITHWVLVELNTVKTYVTSAELNKQTKPA